MNIQIYQYKRNFDVQKAERFFKERRIPFSIVDLKKHPAGKREMELFAQVFGLKSLIDAESEKVRSHPVLYTDDRERILEYLMQDPSLMKLPIVRNGRLMTLGADEAQWTRWMNAEK